MSLPFARTALATALLGVSAAAFAQETLVLGDTVVSAAGYEQKITDAPASVTTSSVVAIVRSLAAHGVRVTAIANAHHDPAHVRALRAAVDEVERDGGATLVFPDLTKRRWAARLTDEFRSGACHAGRYEGSMVLAERPGEVKQETMRRLEPHERSLVEAIRSGIGSFAEAGGRSAYFGVPAEATAEEGRDTIATLGAILHEAVMERMQL